jgi:hypothetical protein
LVKILTSERFMSTVHQEETFDKTDEQGHEIEAKKQEIEKKKKIL